jgi:hypothetical protein
MLDYFSRHDQRAGERNAVFRRDTLSACAMPRLSTRRFTRRRAVDFKRDGAMRCR